ncbi:hypothetical protein ILYODFUR_030393 [Ilyodon furcidens]|uniref:Uncharacterized protein n=1 Tax=Ilyodon furcidens TaxID=33524 RepID=A0ABV0VIG9_9TELE
MSHRDTIRPGNTLEHHRRSWREECLGVPSGIVTSATIKDNWTPMDVHNDCSLSCYNNIENILIGNFFKFKLIPEGHLKSLQTQSGVPSSNLGTTGLRGTAKSPELPNI